VPVAVVGPITVGAGMLLGYPVFVVSAAEKEADTVAMGSMVEKPNEPALPSTAIGPS